MDALPYRLHWQPTNRPPNSGKFFFNAMTTTTEILALHGGPRAVPLALPTFLRSDGRTFGEAEEALVLEALHSGCLTRNGGTMVRRLEAAFSKKLGTAHTVACSSGSAAVHLAVAALDPEPGDEFIVPPVTDLGTILPILWQNCIPVFADIDPDTMTIDPEDVERHITSRTRAIIAVHLAGQPCDMRSLRFLADSHGIVLIEDCAQAYWAEYNGQLVGTLGDLACFSLQQSKHITCGEGGLMTTSNSEYARRALLFSDKAWPRDTGALGAWRFLFLSQNYRMSELQGAVALGQLDKVEDIVNRRRDRAALLTELIADIPGVSPPLVPAGTDPAWWLYMLHVIGVSAKEFGQALLAEGVPGWVEYIVDPLYCSPLFAEQKTYGTSGYPFSQWPGQTFARGLCPNAERALSGVIALHWNENYSESHVHQIANAIAKVASHLRR
jgi:perosamine synthetase